MKSEDGGQQPIRLLIIENQRLLAENNRLLKKMNRRSMLSFWARIIWTIVLIVVPIALYFYYLEPYLVSLGASLEEFQGGFQNFSKWEQFIR